MCDGVEKIILVGGHAVGVVVIENIGRGTKSDRAVKASVGRGHPKRFGLVVIDAEGNELLKAVFGQAPQHPRALLTLLEGVALWSEAALRCVISAEHPVSHSLGLGVFGDEWPEESALVHFQVVERPRRRRRRLRGLAEPRGASWT